MTFDIITERFENKEVRTAQDEKHVLREILQELALYALSRTDFFKLGAFHGGTSLRILHGMRRFSEDLDFILKQPDTTFSWAAYEKALHFEFRVYGIDIEIRDRKNTQAVQALWLKDQSLGKILQLRNPFREGQKISVKLELDTDPPSGSRFEIKYLDFPVPFSLLVQDLESGFANKLHALLCRAYVKGRDWFDFIWYTGRAIKPNLELLENAIIQTGPWADKQTKVDKAWIINSMMNRIKAVDFELARKDVEKFLGEPEIEGLSVWSKDYFKHVVTKMADIL